MFKKGLLFFSRIFVGFVFIFSGFVKGVDPLGSTYKFIDYFTAFKMPWAESLAFPLAIGLAALEFVVGIGLFFNLKIKFNAWMALLFMMFFTPLTLVLAIDNPVSDCGCFGDAIVLTNWETFYKNLVILTFTIIAFKYRKHYKPILGNLAQWSVFSLFAILLSSLSLYCYNHLPIIDFRPYKIGTHIPDGMKLPENAKKPKYETTFYYQNKNTQKVEEFDETNYPWKDTVNWKFVDQKSELIHEGDVPPIHDFVFELPDGYDYTDEMLANPDYSIMIVAYDLEETNIEGHKSLKDLVELCKSKDIQIFGATSSLTKKIEQFKDLVGYEIPYYQADEIMLKTIVRASPGIVLLKNGTIINKWHFNDLPDNTFFKETYFNAE